MSSSANYTSCEKHLESLFGIRSLSHSYNNQAAEKQVYQRMACQTKINAINIKIFLFYCFLYSVSPLKVCKFTSSPVSE